jgi:hypothetical protein
MDIHRIIGNEREVISGATPSQIASLSAKCQFTPSCEAGEIIRDIQLLDTALDRQNFILEELIKSEEVAQHDREKFEDSLGEIRGLIESMQTEMRISYRTLAQKIIKPPDDLDRWDAEYTKKLCELFKELVEIRAPNKELPDTIKISLYALLAISASQASFLIWLAYCLLR